jgi:hypothetical protein
MWPFRNGLSCCRSGTGSIWPPSGHAASYAEFPKTPFPRIKTEGEIFKAKKQLPRRMWMTGETRANDSIGQSMRKSKTLMSQEFTFKLLKRNAFCYLTAKAERTVLSQHMICRSIYLVITSQSVHCQNGHLSTAGAMALPPISVFPREYGSCARRARLCGSTTQSRAYYGTGMWSKCG